jgi:DNA-binding transcriptional ArsR family regulator
MHYTINYGYSTKLYGAGDNMLEGLFGNPVIEKIFFTLITYKEDYPFGMAKNFNEPVNRFQQQLKRLEENGIVISRLIGKVRLYAFNPRYPFLKELKALISKAYEFIPEKEKDQYYRKRMRPRRAGKPL